MSKVAIVNKALTRIGANTITSLDDDTQNARVINRVYDLSLRSILAESKWNFATTRALLAQVANDDPDWFYTAEGEAYVYQKPSDCIRIFGTNSKYAIWREEGDYIISDTTGLGLVYVRYLDDPTKYPSAFIDAFIDRLCADIAYMIVNSATLGERFETLYHTVTLPKAQSQNSQTGTQQTQQDDAWELAKYHNTSAEA